MKKFLIAFFIGLSLTGCVGEVSEGAESQDPELVAYDVEEGETWNSQVEIPSNWEKHTSQRYGYSFAYPPSWSLLAYDEDNPEVKGGVHTLHNYDVDKVEQYMDHGMVNWGSFMGETPVIKMDILVRNLDEQSFADFVAEITQGAEPIEFSELGIDGLETLIFHHGELTGGPFVRAKSYVAQIDENRAIAVVRFSNEENDASLRNSNQWELLEKVFGSFEFD